MTKIKLILAGAVLAVASGALVAVQNKDSVENMVGKTIPSFSMKNVNGKTITDKSLRGKVVVIDLWATWCGPCKKAAPVMQAIHKKYSKKGVVVIGANTWEQGDTKGSKAREYMKEHGYTYTFTYGNDDLAKKWKVEGIPTMLVLDKKGKVQKVLVGFDPKLESQLSATIEPLLR